MNDFEKINIWEKMEVCLVDLGNTCKYDYYIVENSKDLKEAYKDFRERFNADEIEIQGISHSQYITDNLEDIFELIEEIKLVDNYDIELNTVIDVLEATKSIQDTKRIIKDHSYQYIESNNKECAFIEYLEQIDYLRDIPERFINYIDYDKLIRDFEIEGLQIEEVKFNNYLFIY